MTDQIDQILIDWHNWAASKHEPLGYPPTTVAGRLYQPSRQYDDENGSTDAHIDNGYLEIVDKHINEIPQPYRMALAVKARNLVAGYAVFKSPLLPQDNRKRAELTNEAKSMLSKRLEIE